jgi:AcrR family transcriptional regulator
VAVSPKRQRGRDRVDAILRAAATLFVEQGYHAVTMTEVAARSSTAIGSLYRFFPTKEALAGALLDGYSAHLTEALDAIVTRAATLSSGEIAAALIGLVRSLRHERSAVLPLVDVQKDSVALRQALRDGMRDRLATIVARGSLARSERSEPQSIVVLHLLKMAWALQHADPAMQSSLEQEVQALLALYLEKAGAERAASCRSGPPVKQVR